MHTLHQSLQLQHHRHTGRVLHHRHTSYRALSVVFVLAGIFMIGLHAASHAAADSFGISAIVNVPTPSTAPIIASPAADATITGTSTLVTGSCPLVSPQVAVDIKVDGTLAGTGMCDQNNDFTVPVTVHAGNHNLVASTTTMSDQHGPSSSPTTITGSDATSASPITIIADNPVTFLGTDETTTWTGTITSPNPNPLYIHIDWGDSGQYNDTITAGTQSFTHQYHGQYSQNILVSVSDSAGHTAVMQYASAAFTLAAARQPIKAASIYDSRTVTGLYGIYVTAVCTVTLVWLEARHAAKTSYGSQLSSR